MDVKVINHLEITLRGRYDGEDYEFPPEEPTVIPKAAAAHIFGLGVEDKSQALNQLGFLVPGKDTYQEAVKKLDQITFLEGKLTFEDEELDAIDVPEERPRRTKKTGGGPHVSGPGGEAEATAAPRVASANSQ
jgi:hypothetical protein